MIEEKRSYRIRTEVGNDSPINIPLQLTQEFENFEILSLKLNVDGDYHKYVSDEGIIVGRVTTANNGLGIPNVKVSIFVAKGESEQTSAEAIEYPYSAPTDTNNDRIRYNLLPSSSNVVCYQVIGTLPDKQEMLDNRTLCEVFDKYYKYSTVTNEAGDYMLTNVPTGNHRLHIDIDLSDIGPFLSQKPRDMINNLGIDKNKFDSPTKFKKSKDLDSLAQVLTQNKTVYVNPYWGDTTDEHNDELKLTRCDLSVNYEFKTSAVFLGSVVTDQKGNYISKNCTPNNGAGRMENLVTGEGSIEMIRKTINGKVEQYKIQGDQLINENGIWCYSIPMNLDYVKTDEYGNIVPTDDPSKGIPTRARVRFRIGLNDMGDLADNVKRCKILVPNNPRIDDDGFQESLDADYEFGTSTREESYVDMFWNKVYTVKSYIPNIKKNLTQTNRKHGGIKAINHYGDNNPFPYNNLSIKLSFTFRLICNILQIFIGLVGFINFVIQSLGYPFCLLAGLFNSIAKPFKTLCKVKIWKWRPFGFMCIISDLFEGVADLFEMLIIDCIPISEEFCDDGINKFKTYPGCGTGLANLLPGNCTWKQTKSSCESEQYNNQKNGEEQAICTNSTHFLDQCIDNMLAQENDATNFNFYNDWANGVIYFPLWIRKITPKKKFFFGLFSRKAKDQWCSAEKSSNGVKIVQHCAPSRSNQVSGDKSYSGDSVFYYTNDKSKDGKCGECINQTNKPGVPIKKGLIITKETMLGQTVYYYKAVEYAYSTDTNAPVSENGHNGAIKTLFATDIVLLGSLNDCDLNGVPKFFEYLPQTTYNMPTDLLFTDWIITYNLESSGDEATMTSNEVTQSAEANSESSGADWGNGNNEGGPGGLFYGISCNSYDTYGKSCANLTRICELGVSLDETKTIVDTRSMDSVESDTDKLICDGFVSYDELYNLDARSMFATMNGNRLKTKHNETNGLYEYDFRYLYPENFDGSLANYMKDERGNSGSSFQDNYKLEKASLDYLKFRMGDYPYYYDSGHKLPRWENSFYFYFGLKSGKTAIDKFYELYYAPCETEDAESSAVSISAKGNNWCATESIDDTGSWSHGDSYGYDGYVKIDMSSLTSPYSIMFNSKDNDGESYQATGVTNEKVYIGNGECPDGYTKLTLEYENPDMNHEGYESDKCNMVNNGSYELTIGDGDGNYYTYVVDVTREKLEYSLESDDFELTLVQIESKYGKDYVDSILNNVSLTFTADDKDFDSDTDDVKFVREGIGGVITVVNPSMEGEVLSDFKITVNANIDGKSWSREGYDMVKTYDGRKYYGIAVPSPNVSYTVKVIQLCDGKESKNYVEQTQFINEPTAYKLFINGIDTDIIKKLLTNGESVDNWLKLSNKSLYDWTQNEKYLIDYYDGDDAQTQLDEAKNEFINAVKEAFYLLDDDRGYSLSYSVNTDNKPYTIGSYYKDEEDYSDVDGDGIITRYRVLSDSDCNYTFTEDNIVSSMKIPTVTDDDENNEYLGNKDQISGKTYWGEGKKKKNLSSYCKKGWYYVGVEDSNGNFLPTTATSIGSSTDDQKGQLYCFPILDKRFRFVDLYGWSSITTKNGNVLGGYAHCYLYNGFKDFTHDLGDTFKVVTPSTSSEDAVPTVRYVTGSSSVTNLPSVEPSFPTNDYLSTIEITDSKNYTATLHTSVDMYIDPEEETAELTVKDPKIPIISGKYVTLYYSLNGEPTNNGSESDTLNYAYFRNTDGSYPIDDDGNVKDGTFFKYETLDDIINGCGSKYGHVEDGDMIHIEDGDNDYTYLIYNKRYSVEDIMKGWYVFSVVENGDKIKTISRLHHLCGCYYTLCVNEYVDEIGGKRMISVGIEIDQSDYKKYGYKYFNIDGKSTVFVDSLSSSVQTLNGSTMYDENYYKGLNVSFNGRNFEASITDTTDANSLTQKVTYLDTITNEYICCLGIYYYSVAELKTTVKDLDLTESGSFVFSDLTDYSDKLIEAEKDKAYKLEDGEVLYTSFGYETMTEPIFKYTNDSGLITSSFGDWTEINGSSSVDDWISEHKSSSSTATETTVYTNYNDKFKYTKQTLTLSDFDITVELYDENGDKYFAMLKDKDNVIYRKITRSNNLTPTT